MYNSAILAVVVPLLVFFASPVEAAYQFGVGDGLAIVLFLVIAVIAVCALLGWVSRKRSGK